MSLLSTPMLRILFSVLKTNHHHLLLTRKEGIVCGEAMVYVQTAFAILEETLTIFYVAKKRPRPIVAQC